MLEVNTSKIPGGGSGVWTVIGLPPHIRLGPYQGEKSQFPDSQGYSWTVSWRSILFLFYLCIHIKTYWHGYLHSLANNPPPPPLCLKHPPLRVPYLYQPCLSTLLHLNLLSLITPTIWLSKQLPVVLSSPNAFFQVKLEYFIFKRYTIFLCFLFIIQFSALYSKVGLINSNLYGI